MANYNDSELENAFGTTGLAYGKLNPAVVSKQTPYDTNAVDEFSLMRGVIDDYVNPQVLKTESEFVGIVVKIERSILSCKDEGQQLQTIETNAARVEECKHPGPKPKATHARGGGRYGAEAGAADDGSADMADWKRKRKEYIECKEKNKAFTTNILNATEVQNNIGYVRVCIPELDPRPLPSEWPSSAAGDLQAGCRKGQKLSLSIAETYPVFQYGLSLTDQNFITPGALVRVRLTYKPMGPQGITSGVPDVSQGGTILEVIRNDNSQPIILSGGGPPGAKAKAKEVTNPCLDPPLPPQVVADPTKQDSKLTDENIAGLPFVGKMNETFIDPSKKQLTKNLYLEDFGNVPRKFYKNVKILAMNLEVLIQYLHPEGVTKIKARNFKEFRITSGYRSRKKNAETEGTSKISQHMLARASDIVFTKFPPRQVFLAISDLIYRGAMKDGGLGYYSYGRNIKTGRQKGFVHYDVRNPGKQGRGNVPTTTHWTAKHGGPRWYQLDKHGTHTGGMEANIRREVTALGEYHDRAKRQRAELPRLFEDRYWTTTPPPGYPAAEPGVDDAEEPAAAKE